MANAPCMIFAAARLQCVLALTEEGGGEESRDGLSGHWLLFPSVLEHSVLHGRRVAADEVSCGWCIVTHLLKAVLASQNVQAPASQTLRAFPAYLALRLSFHGKVQNANAFEDLLEKTFSRSCFTEIWELCQSVSR